MPFIQTCLAQSESASPKATTLYVYNMSPILAACLLNRYKLPTNKARGLTTPRSSKPPLPDSADAIAAEIEVSQRWALRQHCCKPLCPSWPDLIVPEIEVSQRWALRQHSCKSFCPGWSNDIEAEIEVIQRCALP
jgi:hypothetical protein